MIMCYDIDYNNTTLARIEPMMEMYHTLLKITQL
jgi:hypothetical protein